jgi:hypothetical protein
LNTVDQARISRQYIGCLKTLSAPGIVPDQPRRGGVPAVSNIRVNAAETILINMVMPCLAEEAVHLQT